MELYNFIGGKFVAAEKHLDSYDPAMASVWARIPDSGSDEVEQAVQAAQQAFPEWSKTPIVRRCRILLRAAELLEVKLDEFATAESRDQGKTIVQARSIEMPRAVLNLRHFATVYQNITEKSKWQDDVGALNYTLRQPVGIAGLICPWNLPLYLLTFKLAPAIICGNCVVCKPSEMTSVTAFMLCSLLKEAGVPAGVVNMVFGRGPTAGEAIVRHPKIKIISFTGSTKVGLHIYKLAAEHNKKLSLEMGGKNAGIIFDDADLEQCVPTIVRSSFLNQGEVCLCTSRLFVQRTIFNDFIEKFVSATKLIKIGFPLNESTTMGALISAEHLAKVQGYVDTALASGAKVVTGYGSHDWASSLPEEFKQGYFMLPTVLTNVKDSDACMKKEIFGPVVCVVPFDTEKEVVERSNETQYGLCASVWSKNIDRVHSVAQQLQVGTVWCNCWLVRCLDFPFGGAKLSGLGREGTGESFQFFTEVKTICVKVST